MAEDLRVMHAAFTGLRGASRLIVPALTHSWMPGIQSEIPHGFESVFTRGGRASGLSPEARRTRRELLEPNGCERPGIDALMDAWNPERNSTWLRVGVHAGWQSVRFEPRGSADTTRAFGAERL